MRIHGAFALSWAGHRARKEFRAAGNQTQPAHSSIHCDYATELEPAAVSDDLDAALISVMTARTAQAGKRRS